MEFTLWGVRGSIASSAQSNRYYGANTSCVGLKLTSGELFIFDAGTGISSLSKTLPESGECNLFISHAHSDHVQGISFFEPMYRPGWIINIYMPRRQPDLLDRCFDGTSFPVDFSALKSRINIKLMDPGELLRFNCGSGPATVLAIEGNHPGGSIAYKLSAEGEVFLYSGDHEITADPKVRAHTFEMLEGVTTAVVDAAYSRDDYMEGWGHSAAEDWVDMAAEKWVNSLVLTHHAQYREDTDLDKTQHRLGLYRNRGMNIVVAREGMNFPVKKNCLIPAMPSTWQNDFIVNISQYKDESVVLDRILAKTRELCNAEAGTIYLREENELVFAYTHNDFLFPQNKSYKYSYSNIRIPISGSSIAGYVAVTDTALNLPDVHTLPPDAPYSFNASFDKKTGYRTESMLTVPILSHGRFLLGVVQLINSLVPGSRAPRPFTEEMVREVSYLAREAATYLEISNNVRENIYRLMHITVLRDPSETGAHAERVGSIAAEIYQAWAERRQESVDVVRFYRSQLRLAAMLHDVGKIAIEDRILKKPGKLTEKEFDRMRAHTRLGAELFSAVPSDVTELAHDISLHHHQKWDGTGYPRLPEGACPSGTAIPFAARVASIADVFDALVSPRCYKKQWTFEQAMDFIRSEAGHSFDPELTECFLEIKDTIPLIYEKFPYIELTHDPETEEPLCDAEDA